MFSSLTAVAFIPAKGHSNRLPNKNISNLHGKSLIEHSIEYAKKSMIVKDIFVSSDSNQIKMIAEKNNTKFITRPNNLVGETEVADVYYDFSTKVDISKYDYFIGLQPDHPDRQNDLDVIIKYAYEKKYMDLFTINPDGSRNGSVRIIEVNYLKQGKFSRRVGSMNDFCTNIETPEQLEKVRSKFNK